ncbi:MAG TPA: prepilin-type cleavage/methylation domain-containing protein [Vibrio sp.]|uniref:type IV pilus modification PilV family protein n=1 Tax=Vibrio TaxID=662 RepID=UPI0004007D4B|nr:MULTISPECIES: type II secretion system protein [Vibrio]HCH01523.1 prepilin-type cleavage/methylation domain-containing protein [Vibrio sp.]
MKNNKIKQKAQRGFTLIESIVAMVVMGIAMTILFSIFFPRVEDSGRPQYIVRASALGQSVMNTILARSFDQNSDPSGGVIRCDDTTVNSDLDTDPPKCSTQLELGPDEGESVANDFNDVDDYGVEADGTAGRCWSQPESGNCAPLSDLINDSTKYANFKVEVSVVDANTPELTANQPSGTHIMKKITVTVSSQRYESFKIVAYRGNY